MTIEPKDIVVTVPQTQWLRWLAEGDLPGDPRAEGETWGYAIGATRPNVQPGARVYVVAYGLVRGYAPLVLVEQMMGGRYSLVRREGAEALTLSDHDGQPLSVKPFRGFRYRWWPRDQEIDFPDWPTRGLPDVERSHVESLMKARQDASKRTALRRWALGEEGTKP